MNKQGSIKTQGMNKPDAMTSDTEETTSTTAPAYRAKVVQQRLDITPPDTAMPAKTETNEWQMDSAKARISTGGLTLGLGVLSIIGFLVFDAYTTLTASVAEHPIASTALAVLLSGFAKQLPIDSIFG